MDRQRLPAWHDWGTVKQPEITQVLPKECNEQSSGHLKTTIIVPYALALLMLPISHFHISSKKQMPKIKSQVVLPLLSCLVFSPLSSIMLPFIFIFCRNIGSTKKQNLSMIASGLTYLILSETTVLKRSRNSCYKNMPCQFIFCSHVFLSQDSRI